MRRGRSVQFTQAGQPLRIVEDEIAGPRPGELLLRLEMAGICGSDVHRLAGDLPGSGKPVCFGHEAIGIVEAIGDSAARDASGANVSVGDRVYWFPVSLCGECEPCRHNQSVSFCETFVWPLPADRANAAAFQDYATIGPGVPFYRVPERTSSEAVIAFGCAMPTAIGGFLRLGALDGPVVVQGSGPLGLASVVLAARAGAKVIVIGDPEPRLAMARQLGASETIALTGTTRAERKQIILDLTGGSGAATVIEAAGHAAAFEEGIDLLARQGRYLIMGLYSGDATVPVNPVTINNRNLTVIGSLGYPKAALQQTVALAHEIGERYRFADLVTHRFDLNNTEEAIAMAARGEAIKAIVVP